MASQPLPIPSQPLRGADGQVVAYFVPAEEMQRLLAEVESLKRKLAGVTHQRDVYMAELDEMLKTSIPIPPTEEEMAEAAANDNSHEIDAIIDWLQSQVGGADGNR